MYLGLQWPQKVKKHRLCIDVISSARLGVCVYRGEFKMEEQLKAYESYDKWGPGEYNFCSMVRCVAL